MAGTALSRTVARATETSARSTQPIHKQDTLDRPTTAAHYLDIQL